MLRIKTWLSLVALTLLVYAPSKYPTAQVTDAVELPRAGDGQWRLNPNSSPEDIYRQVANGATAYLRSQVPLEWRQMWSAQRALAEAEALGKRVSQLEGVADRMPVIGVGRACRMFEPWNRLTVNGEAVPHETDAAPSPRGGPDNEVVVGTGELLLEETDISLPGRGGLGLSFVRYYSSHVGYDGPLGPGWDHNCNQRIVAEGNPSKPTALIWYTGRRPIRFEWKNGTWEPEPGAFYQLTLNDNQITIETPLRVRLTFTATSSSVGGGRWRIASIASRHDQWRANVIRFTYWPGSDRLQVVEDAYGNRLQFGYDPSGKLTGVVCGQLAVLYQYDELGRLTRVVLPRVATELTKTADVTWEYRYGTGLDGRTRLVAIIPPKGEPEKHYSYETDSNAPAYGRVGGIVLRGAGDTPSVVEWRFETIHKEKTWTVIYKQPLPLPEERWTFPEIGRWPGCYPLCREIPSQNATWSWVHNAAGQKLEARSPLGQVTRWEYASDHRDPRFRGNLLAKREKARPGSGLPIVERGWEWTYHKDIALPIEAVVYQIENGGAKRVLLRQSYEYDPTNLEVSIERVGDTETRIVRNRYGLPVVSWDGRGCATVYRYYSRFNEGLASEGNGGLLAETIEDVPQTTLTQALRVAGVSLSRDERLPERQAEGKPCQRTSRYGYDGLGRRVKEIYPSYTVYHLLNKRGLRLALLDTRSDLTVYDYDAALRLVAQWQRFTPLLLAVYRGEQRVDTPGHFVVQKFRYDSLGRMVAWQPTLERFGIDRNEPVEVKYEYYASGVLRKRVTPGGTAVEIEYDTTSGKPKAFLLIARNAPEEKLILRQAMRYDPEGFLVGYKDARGATYEQKPDGFGRLYAVVRPDGVRTETLRDGLDRPVQERVLSSDGKVLHETQYEYDQAGRLVCSREHRLAKGIDEWLIAEENRYDAEGNVIGRRSYRDDAWHTFAYDGLGRIVRSQSPTGECSEIYYRDDAVCVETIHRVDTRDGQIYKMRFVTLRDEHGNPWCRIPVGHDGLVGLRRAQLTEHDSFGRIVFEAQPDQPGILRVFNTLGSVDRELTRSASNKVLQERWMDYAPDGLLLRRSIANEPLCFFSTGQESLVRVQRLPVPQVYTADYDPFRRLRKEILPDGRVHEYTYGDDSLLRQLVEYHSTKPETKNVIKLDYDILGRLAAVSEGTGRKLQAFDYDAFGNITKADDYTQVNHPVSVSREYDSLGTLLREEFNLPRDFSTLPVISYGHNLRHGRHTLHIEVGQSPWDGWRSLTFEGDADGRVRRILKDDSEFCRLEYLGQSVVSKNFVEQKVTDTITATDSFLEPLEQKIFDTDIANLGQGENANIVYQARYLRDHWERIEASSAEVPPRKWQWTYCCARDELGNISAEQGHGIFYSDPEELAATRQSLLRVTQQGSSVSGNPPLGAYCVRRHEYDQVGNRVATYEGLAAQRWPEGTNLASTAPPIRDLQASISTGQGVGQHVQSRSEEHVLLAAKPSSATTISHLGDWSQDEPTFALASSQDRQDSVLLARLASYTEDRNVGPVAFARRDSVPLPPVNDRMALASNRIRCTAETTKQPDRASVSQEYEYDSFGRLIEYSSSTSGEPICWELEYDPLGRLIAMKGFEVNSSVSLDQANSTPRYSLRFAYDPFGRRIVKRVSRATPNGTSSDLNVTLYRDNRPLLKLSPSSQNPQHWRLVGQYIWRSGTSEVLAFYGEIPEHFSGKREWVLHQDLAYNVILGSTRRDGKLELSDIASYWGHGTNSTTPAIARIDCSFVPESSSGKSESSRVDPQWVIDRSLDDRSATWFSHGRNRSERGFLTLYFEKKYRPVEVRLWAERLPRQFTVYVVSAADVPKTAESLTDWEKKHENNSVAQYPNFSNKQFESQQESPFDVRNPVRIRLSRQREGEAVVLVWQEAINITLREIEVVVHPTYCGDLAFGAAVYDAETGLYYHGARYRLPELGHFIAPDPLGFLGGDNLYAFAHNDPLSWHDPDGRFAHVLLGAGTGALFGAGSYLAQWLRYGEEFSWKRLAVYTASGAASGAVGALVAPFALSVGGYYSLSATWNAILSSSLAGASAGAAGGAIQSGGLTYLRTGDIGESLKAAGFGALGGAAFGAIGGVIGGSVVSRTGGSFRGFVLSGAAGGGVVGFAVDAYKGYRETGTLVGTVKYGLWGAGKGAAVGAAIGGAAWGIGRVTGWIRRLPEQPEGLPDPREEGILIRTKPRRGDYGNVEVEPGYARHHKKPLSLGGTDDPSNIVKVPVEIHRQPHPGREVIEAPLGTIFY